jgi:hypothetical protein
VQPEYEDITSTAESFKNKITFPCGSIALAETVNTVITSKAQSHSGPALLNAVHRAVCSESLPPPRDPVGRSFPVARSGSRSSTPELLDGGRALILLQMVGSMAATRKIVCVHSERRVFGREAARFTENRRNTAWCFPLGSREAFRLIGSSS